MTPETERADKLLQVAAPQAGVASGAQGGEKEKRADDGGEDVQGDHRRTVTSTENNMKPSNPASAMRRM